MASGNPSGLLRLRCLLTTAATESHVARDVALLDAAELSTYRRFRAADDRRDYGAAHALLRRMLSDAAPDMAPRDWRFERTERGKPYLPATLAGVPPIRFSLSHTRGLVACAVGRGADVGVDAERCSRIADVHRLMSGVCSVDEHAHVSGAHPSARAGLFLDLWTLKEAYVKARGLGIAVALDQVSFDLRTPRTISACLPGTAAGEWWLALFRPNADSRVAVAVSTGSRLPPDLDAALDSTGGAQIPLFPVRTSTSTPPSG